MPLRVCGRSVRTLHWRTRRCAGAVDQDVLHHPQILVIENGRVMESGTHTELLALGRRYADLYRTQFADGERRTVEVA